MVVSLAPALALGNARPNNEHMHWNVLCVPVEPRVGYTLARVPS